VNRGVIRSQILAYLGTTADDPAYLPAVLDPIIQQAYDSIIAAIHQENRAYLSTVKTLAADSATSHTYSFTSQSPALTDFAFWLEVRYTDEDGALLEECRLEELRGAGADFFTIVGTDEVAQLITSKDSIAGNALYFRYTYHQGNMASDSETPERLPVKFHDLIALEALFCYGLGGESSLPRELYTRWIDRKGQLMASVGRRGVQPSRTRILQGIDL